MVWARQGLIVGENTGVPFICSHTQMPIPHRLSDEVLRIFFTGRDEKGRSHPAFIDVQATDLQTVLSVSTEPILPHGPAGAFDDSGVMPSCLLARDSEIYMYYIGWNTGSTVPYRLSIGLATSHDGGRTFKKYSTGPIMDRSVCDPYFVTTPFVEVDANGGLRMFYSSCTAWELIDGRLESIYTLRQAFSKDGVNWTPVQADLIDRIFEEEAVARPWVTTDFITSSERKRLWFCARGSKSFRSNKETSYRIGSAVAIDLPASFLRQEDYGVICPPETDEWDSEMNAYASFLELNGVWHMFYNGNGFGRSGIGFAVWK